MRPTFGILQAARRVVEPHRSHTSSPCRPDVATLATPGLGCSYSQSRIICLHRTDTGLAFDPAEAEWALACLGTVGLPDDQAHQLVSSVASSVPATDVTIGVRVCRTCFERRVD